MSTTAVEVTELAQRWKEVLSKASAGDEVILTEQSIPKARVVPLPPHRGSRVPGLHAGLIEIADDFDAPLPDDYWTGSNEGAD